MRSLIVSISVCVVLVFACQSFAGETVVSLDSLPNAKATASNPVLPWRKDQEKREDRIDKGLNDGLQQILNEIRGLRNDQKAAPAPACPCPTPVVVAPEPKESPIEKKVDEVKEKADALLESPFLKHLAIILGVVLGGLLAHAVYVKCHADKAKIDADLEKNAPHLKAIFDKIDDFNTKINDKILGVKSEVADKVDGVKAQVAATQTQVAATQASVAQVALAVPAPAQVAPVVPAVVAK